MNPIARSITTTTGGRDRQEDGEEQDVNREIHTHHTLSLQIYSNPFVCWIRSFDSRIVSIPLQVSHPLLPILFVCCVFIPRSQSAEEAGEGAKRTWQVVCGGVLLSVPTIESTTTFYVPPYIRHYSSAPWVGISCCCCCCCCPDKVGVHGTAKSTYAGWHGDMVK